MKHTLAICTSSLLATGIAAQDQRQVLSEAVRQAKVTLVEAAQKANAVQPGTVIAAALQTATTDRTAGWRIVVLREGKLFAVSVDAASGAVGKAKELTDDDDDDEPGEAKESAAPGKQPAKEGKVEQRESARLDFEDVTPGSLPAGWAAAETAGAGKPATWRVVDLAGAPSGKRVLRLGETKNSGSTFNLLLSAAVFPANLDLAVKIHADSGEEDQGGGLVWRAKDADNYYLTRWNPLEDNLRTYKVAGGRRTMFKSIDLKVDPAQWHSLRVRAQGTKFQVWFDDKPMLDFEDETFRAAGRVGLWTKADAASSFDDLEVAARR
jgi:hypothetical protein